jgi:hypothetical protein
MRILWTSLVGRGCFLLSTIKFADLNVCDGMTACYSTKKFVGSKNNMFTLSRMACKVASWLVLMLLSDISFTLSTKGSKESFIWISLDASSPPSSHQKKFEINELFIISLPSKYQVHRLIGSSALPVVRQIFAAMYR